MKRLAASLAFVSAMAGAGSAGAWGWQGHQLTGAIADQLLNPNARQHVQQILGTSLQVAGPWADCARGWKFSQGDYHWSDNGIAKVCKPFLTDAGKAEMKVYVQDNQNQCKDDDPKRACHAKYHFADTPEFERRYIPPKHAGANDHDVVHTINAAVARLQGKPVPPPFKITTDRQALFLLAHMVGDLHQPLHVGAIYLTPAGKSVDPHNPPAKSQKTQGGNLIQYKGTAQLHGTWDDIDPQLKTDGAPFADAARALPATSGDFHGWAATWANDTVAQADAKGFAGLTFGKFGPIQVSPSKVQKWWPITDRPTGYAADLEAEQKAQVIKGGRHLADLLNAIWPA